jgi:hypothetical protein
MKQIVLLLLLIGGGILSTQAQGRGRGYDRDDRGRGHDKHYRVHRGGRWDDCNKHYRGAYYDCRPAAQVVYVPAPPPPPARVVYHRAPKVVIATGPIVIGL